MDDFGGKDIQVTLICNIALIKKGKALTAWIQIHYRNICSGFYEFLRRSQTNTVAASGDNRNFIFEHGFLQKEIFRFMNDEEQSRPLSLYPYYIRFFLPCVNL